MKTITIIDTFGFFFRSYYALPNLKNSKGEPTGLLMGFVNFVFSLERDYPSDYILFALDSKGKTFRHDIDKNYKANRTEPPEDLKKQLPIAIEWIKKMGFAEYSKEGYEADDVIASMVKFAKSSDLKVRVVTHDKDLYQLIDDGKVTIFEPVKKIEIDKKGCFEKFGLPPYKIRDYLALTGDVSDNIPGVKGIGAVGAKKLLDEFGDLEGIYENLDKVRNERIKELLRQGRESAFISLKLTALDDSLDVYQKLENFKFPASEPLFAIKDELFENSMHSVLNRISVKKIRDVLSFEAILLDTKDKLFEIINKIPQSALLAFDTETDSLDSRNANIVGFSFCFEEDRAYYVPIAHFYLGVGGQVDKEDAKSALLLLFKHKIIGQNIKFDMNVISNNFNMDIDIYADTMLMAWLLDSEYSVSMDSLAKRLLNYTTVKFSDIIQKNSTFANVDIKTACDYSAEDAWVTLKLFHKLKELLEPKLLEIARNVEFLFIEVLRDMENEGIKVDTEYLKNLLRKSDNAVAELTREIYDLCGREFNINSPQQMGVILFEHLGLKSSKKTKIGGYSTEENVLSELINEHPVIEKLLEYRELFKLKSTYIEPLLKLGLSDKNSRIHTSFLQTGTSTGRLSSKEPNLQNIPVRTELGKEVRTAFVAKEGFKLVGIDYSQIELRLLAHFSLDKALVDAFMDDKDIHSETALKLFGENAKNMRSVAKSINFGLLYGMGARKLAQTIGVSQDEAKGYIESYFASFPTVKTYLASIEDGARKEGFIRTILGRKRNFDFAAASAFQIANYNREAINAVFQGSAADLIKLAMLKIKNSILGDDAKLLLQIHDELIFEVKDEKALDFSKQASEIMENIYKLNVPLKTTISIGDNWGELK
ncbi:MAG: DNA polymerase I [Campylobacteraceae bacterium]|jgi:DNA polymerase-1|nr:DNA polymerase I [Campylobacteraceae bacterium]